MALFTGEKQRTHETENVEAVFRAAGYDDVEAYRYSSASIRVRVRDERLRGLSRGARMELLEPIIDQLPDETQQELIFVLPIAPGEEKDDFMLMNLEFESPRPPSF